MSDQLTIIPNGFGDKNAGKKGSPEPTTNDKKEPTLQLEKGTVFDRLKKVRLPGGYTINLYVVFGILAAFFVLVFGYAYFFADDGIPNLRPLADIKVDVGNNQELVMNPLTGEMHSVFDAESWRGVRPLAVMINNYVDARPHSGLVDADLVYEIVAEGGITRFLAFFQSKTPEKIGPVRSTRHYYLTLVKELGDAMIMHIGYSPQALQAIETWPVRSLARGGAEFWRDENRLNAGVATEHTAYVDGTYLRRLGDELGWQGTNEDFVPWKFKDDNKLAKSADLCNVGECKPITIHFWSEGEYSAIWTFNPETNTYLRFTGYDEAGNPIPHIDQETGKQVEVKNMIVQFALEEPILEDNSSRLNYELEGSGTAIVFRDGAALPVTWTKAGRDDRTMFYDESGEELEFNRGKFWISIVPDRNKDQVSY